MLSKHLVPLWMGFRTFYNLPDVKDSVAKLLRTQVASLDTPDTQSMVYREDAVLQITWSFL